MAKITKTISLLPAVRIYTAVDLARMPLQTMNTCLAAQEKFFVDNATLRSEAKSVKTSIELGHPLIVCFERKRSRVARKFFLGGGADMEEIKAGVINQLTKRGFIAVPETPSIGSKDWLVEEGK